VCDYVTEHLADQNAVLVIDETGFLKQGADSGPSRTVIPAHRGQHSGDRGQFLMSV